MNSVVVLYSSGESVLLIKRRSEKSDATSKDTTLEKIQTPIDKIDEELLEMILGDGVAAFSTPGLHFELCPFFPII